MNQFSQRRWGSQPAAPSAGCAFKNPKAMPAGKLIEELGLKGRRVGGASVSLEKAISLSMTAARPRGTSWI